VSVNVVTHLNFRGDARSALEFYQSVFGGDLTAISYQDMGNVQDPSEANWVVWGQVAATNGIRVMAYDVPARTPWNRGENSFFVSLRGDTAEQITGYWEELADGATVMQPLAPAQWAVLYGMMKDRFGITWVVDVVTEYNAS
jgi:PhnB protein